MPPFFPSLFSQPAKNSLFHFLCQSSPDVFIAGTLTLGAEGDSGEAIPIGVSGFIFSFLVNEMIECFLCLGAIDLCVPTACSPWCVRHKEMGQETATGGEQNMSFFVTRTVHFLLAHSRLGLE